MSFSKQPFFRRLKCYEKKKRIWKKMVDKADRVPVTYEDLKQGPLKVRLITLCRSRDVLVLLRSNVLIFEN